MKQSLAPFVLLLSVACACGQRPASDAPPDGGAPPEARPTAARRFFWWKYTVGLTGRCAGMPTNTSPAQPR